jgi:hypothetical protein
VCQFCLTQDQIQYTVLCHYCGQEADNSLHCDICNDGPANYCGCSPPICTQCLLQAATVGPTRRFFCVSCGIATPPGCPFCAVSAQGCHAVSAQGVQCSAGLRCAVCFAQHGCTLCHNRAASCAAQPGPHSRR